MTIDELQELLGPQADHRHYKAFIESAITARRTRTPLGSDVAPGLGPSELAEFLASLVQRCFTLETLIEDLQERVRQHVEDLDGAHPRG